MLSCSTDILGSSVMLLNRCGNRQFYTKVMIGGWLKVRRLIERPTQQHKRRILSPFLRRLCYRQANDQGRGVVTIFTPRANCM